MYMYINKNNMYNNKIQNLFLKYKIYISMFRFRFITLFYEIKPTI